MRSMAVVFEAAGYSLARDPGAELRGARRGKHASPRSRRQPRAEGAVAAPAGRGRDPLVLFDDRARRARGRTPACSRPPPARTATTGSSAARKWFITGYDGAKLNIVMARTSDRIERGRGATMFLVDNDEPAIEAVRRQETLESSFAGGHYELRFDDLRVNCRPGARRDRRGLPSTPRCGSRPRGSRTACAGSARRSARMTSPAGTRCGARRSASRSPSTKESGSCSRTTSSTCTSRGSSIWQAAWVLDQGGQARQESSMAKVFCSEAEFRIVDRCMQILGGMGITSDTLVERLWREVRPFRIYDGPNEVHRWAIAKRIAKEARSSASDAEELRWFAVREVSVRCPPMPLQRLAPRTSRAVSFGFRYPPLPGAQSWCSPDSRDRTSAPRLRCRDRHRSSTPRRASNV